MGEESSGFGVRALTLRWSPPTASFNPPACSARPSRGGGGGGRGWETCSSSLDSRLLPDNVWWKGEAAEEVRMRDCYAHTFTETCLHHNIRDQAVALEGWTGFRTLDEENWTLDVELLILRCQPHYHQRLLVTFTPTQMQKMDCLRICIYLNNCIHVLLLSEFIHLCYASLFCLMPNKWPWTV